MTIDFNDVSVEGLDWAVDRIQDAGATGVLTFPGGAQVTFGSVAPTLEFSDLHIQQMADPYGEPEDFKIPRRVIKYNFDEDADTPTNRLVMKTARSRGTFLAIRLGATPIVTATMPGGEYVAVYVGDVMAPGKKPATTAEVSRAFAAWVQDVAYKHRNSPGHGVGFTRYDRG